MNPQTLEEIEMTDFETGKEIDKKHYILIQDSEKDLISKINTDTYNNRVREELSERYVSKLGNFERAGEDKIYQIFVATMNGTKYIGKMSKDMLKKGFPETFKYFNESKFLN